MGRVAVPVELSVDALAYGSDRVLPVRLPVNVSGAGDNSLIAALPGKKALLVAGLFMASATVTVRFEDGAAGPDLSGDISLIANVGFVIPYLPIGWALTSVNTALNLNLSAGVQIGGFLVYVPISL